MRPTRRHPLRSPPPCLRGRATGTTLVLLAALLGGCVHRAPPDAAAAEARPAPVPQAPRDRAAAAASAAAAVRAAAFDRQMIQLALDSGCLQCHGLVSGSPGSDERRGIGPSWPEVARKYRGKAYALDMLTQTVLKGSDPYEAHWRGKVSGLAMPEHTMAIAPADARYLVR